MKGLRIVARHLAPSLPEREEFVHLGALALAKVIGVKRALLRMGRNFKRAANDIETKARDVGREVQLRTFTAPQFLGKASDRSTLITDYRRGVLEEVLALLGIAGTVEAVEVHVERQDVTFRITWR